MSKMYYSLVEAFLLGKFRSIGEPIGPLTDEEAKYLVMSQTLSDTPPKKREVAPALLQEPAPADIGRKTR